MSDAAQSGKHVELSDLQSVKLGIGDVVQLQDFSHEKLRHYVKLIGYLHKKSVVVSHPMRDEKLLFIKKGESFLLRGFSGTRTDEFTADVVNVCLQPYPYLHLSYPVQINTVNMRAALRIKRRLVCSVCLKDSGQTTPATIEDMSISGARIQSRTAFGKIGDKVEVSFRLPIDGLEVARGAGHHPQRGQRGRSFRCRKTGVERSGIPSAGRDRTDLSAQLYLQKHGRQLNARPDTMRKEMTT